MYLSAQELAERFGVSTVTIWRWNQTKPNFPDPVLLSTRCTRWRIADIERFEATLNAQRSA